MDQAPSVGSRELLTHRKAERLPGTIDCGVESTQDRCGEMHKSGSSSDLSCGLRTPLFQGPNRWLLSATPHSENIPYVTTVVLNFRSSLAPMLFLVVEPQYDLSRLLLLLRMD